MARGKKKETLTPEERLQVALVPEGEQPYKVPRNWCWVYAPSMFNIEYGKGLPTKKLCEDGYPVFGANGQIGFYNEYMFEDEKALMSCRGAYSGTMNLSLPKSFITNNSLIIETKLADISVKFVFYLYSALNKAKLISGSAQPQVTVQAFNNYPVPVPPLAEQQRIVDRIESLFAKLDEARQKAQDALDSFETRKAAILHRAFTGELTAQWRKEHGVGMESWERHPLKDVTQIGSGGTPSRKNSQYYLGDILWVKTGEIYWNYIYDSEEKITEEAIANSSAKLYPAGTVLVAMYGQGLTRGRAAILGVPATTNQAVCALQPCDCLEKRYLYYYFMANYWEYREKAVGGNQPNYSATMIGKWIINIPSVLEQAEIVRILDDLLAKEQQAKDAAEGVLEQIDLIKKAILARAFRGELGTNDPSEESAVELVKRVLAVEPPPKARAKAVSIPREVEEQLKCELERKIMKLYYYSDSQSLPINTLMEVSSKKFEVLESIRNLEQRGIIKKLPNGNYKLVR